MKLRFATIAAIAVSISDPTWAAALTIRTGESWVFVVRNGEPAKARKVAASTKPKRGEVVASVNSLMGTTMTLVGNVPVSYTFRAELLGVAGGKPGAARTCALPANGRLVMENWPAKAQAVRIGKFRPTDSTRC